MMKKNKDMSFSVAFREEIEHLYYVSFRPAFQKNKSCNSEKDINDIIYKLCKDTNCKQMNDIK